MTTLLYQKLRNEIAQVAKETEFYEAKNDPIKKEQTTLSNWKPNLISFSDINPKPIRWLWKNRFPSGCLSAIVGRPGAGKSFLTCDMAARVSNGTNWTDGSDCKQGDVILICCEDDPHQVIRPRLDAHGANVERIKLLTTKIQHPVDGEPVEDLISLLDTGLIEQTLKATPDCRLIIVDPIGSYLGGKIDSYRDNEVRSVLAPIAKLAERYDCAVVIVVHTRKGASQNADDTALGSRAFVGISRAVWHVMEDTENNDRKLFLPGKSNLSSQNTGLAYRIEGSQMARVVWSNDIVEMSANDAMASSFDDGEQSALDEACEWLKRYLQDGSKSAKLLQKDAASDGIAKRTLDRAKAKLKIISKPGGMGEPWLWQFPNSLQCSPTSSSVRQTNTMANTGNTLANTGRRQTQRDTITPLDTENSNLGWLDDF